MSEDWHSYSIAELVDEDRPICYGVLKPGDYYDQGVPLVRIVDVEGDKLNEEGLFRISAALDREFHRSRLLGGELVVSIQGTIGRVALIPSELRGANISRTLARLAIKPNHIAEFVRFSLVSEHGQRLLADAVMGTTRDSLNIGALRKIEILLPNKQQQRRIASILTTLDEEIEATEALITKHQQIKAGLMHDLFTRGLWSQAELARGDHKGLPCESTAKEGQLRPPPEAAPGLYQETEIGLVPKAWKLSTIGDVAESIADGPFGSNLKTEHYVEEAGVRVVRLQNIQDTIYNDEDRAFVSDSHANYLIRNQVISGDILVAGLGEDKHVVARACCYPEGLPSAINKADCFRLRCDNEKALNPFVMFYLNTNIARTEVRKYEQGVTRRRINGGNLKRVRFGLPAIAEQKTAVAMLESAATVIESISEQIAKLRQKKQGLMHDLLTGRVRVANS